MKLVNWFVLGLAVFAPLSLGAQTSTYDGLVKGIVLSIPERPQCDSGLEGFLFFDRDGNRAEVCSSSTWTTIVVDADSDGIVSTSDADDADAAVTLANLVAGNIKQGITILGITGTLASSGIIDADMDGIVSTSDVDDSDASKTLANLIGTNIKLGVTIHGVAGLYDPGIPYADLAPFLTAGLTVNSRRLLGTRCAATKACIKKGRNAAVSFTTSSSNYPSVYWYGTGTGDAPCTGDELSNFTVTTDNSNAHKTVTSLTCGYLWPRK